MPRKRKQTAYLSNRRKKGRYVRKDTRDNCNVNKINYNDDIEIVDNDSNSLSSSSNSTNKSNIDTIKVPSKTDIANNITARVISDDENDQMEDEVPII